MSPLEPFRGQVSVVVSSCDRFFDCWRPFAFFHRKYWPRCPFPVYLVTNQLDVRSDVVRSIRVGRDEGWATNMRVALQQIPTPYVFYLQEDYLFKVPVDEAQLADDFTVALREGMDGLCFVTLAYLEPAFARIKERFAAIPRDSKGRTRLQATLWRRDAFDSLLLPGETAWEMEARGSARSTGLQIFSYGMRDRPPVQYTLSAIVRGLWTREAIALCKAHGLRIEPNFRSRDPGDKFGRRIRRAIDRVRFRIALARNAGRPIELDAIP